MKYSGSGVKKVTGTLATKSSLDHEYENLTNGVELSWDFDPTTLSHDQQTEKEVHQKFCNFLNERALTIDIWDGDSMMLFGQCKVPLYLLMRSGKPMSVTGMEFDVFEPENASKIGGLQLVLSNQGRII